MMTVNAWTLYKIDCKDPEFPKKDIEDQLIELQGYQYAQKEKRGSTASIPDIEVRRYQTSHWPLVGEERLRCKQLSSIIFSKCNVHLCLRKKKYCFGHFHI